MPVVPEITRTVQVKLFYIAERDVLPVCSPPDPTSFLVESVVFVLRSQSRLLLLGIFDVLILVDEF